MSDKALRIIHGDDPLPPDEDLWDVKRAAQFLGLSIDGVYRAAERGDIPSIRVLNRRRFVPEHLRVWAARGDTPSR